jgi:glycosyltransferase involved in cell wall biosynthesis
VSILVLAPQGTHALLGDLDYARCLGRGSDAVHRLDPEAIYCEGGIDHLEDTVVDAVREHHVNVLVYALGFEFDFRPTFFRERLGHIYRVLLVGDDEHYFDRSHRYFAQCFDRVLTTNPVCDRYDLYGVEAEFIPVPYDSTVFHPGDRPAKEIDVSFIGAMHGKVGRARYARALKAAGVKFECFGTGTPGGYVDQARSIDIYRKSRINLNFAGGSFVTPLDRDLAINRRVRQMKGRCYMLALCSSFVLSERVAGIERAFHIGQEIDVFDNEVELIDKIDFYLKHGDRREEMAARAYQRAIAHYDEQNLGRRLVGDLESRAKAKKAASDAPIYLDRNFWACFGSWRFKYLSLFLFRGRYRLLLSELALLFRIAKVHPYAALWYAAHGLHVAARTSPAAGRVTKWVRRLRRSIMKDER